MSPHRPTHTPRLCQNTWHHRTMRWCGGAAAATVAVAGCGCWVDGQTGSAALAAVQPCGHVSAGNGVLWRGGQLGRCAGAKGGVVGGIPFLPPFR
eukprot:360384-Chlamydomonas_euryale.AAC.2